MPPRPPPTPPVLIVLCSAAAALAVWLSLAVNAVTRGLAGRLAGVRFDGVVLDERNWYLPLALQGPTDSASVWGWAGMLLSGPLAVLLLAALLHGVTGLLRASGPVRGFSLAWLVVALLWLPVALGATALPDGSGPMVELYRRLGDPPAGRWAAAGLALVTLFVLAEVISLRAVAVGRAWMRADGLEFRRRLVRVVAGWPGAVAAAALSFGAGWAPTPWAIVICVTILLALRIRTD